MSDSTKLINLDLLSRYDTNKKAREDTKISNHILSNKNKEIARYFRMNRDGKIYGVKFAYTSAGVIVPAGTKYGANEGLVVNPSTRTVAGRDDYANINVFKSIDANVHYGADGNIVIDAIAGEPGFSYTGKVDVVCLFASVYERVYNETVNGTDYLCIEWTDTHRDGFTLNNLCKDVDGKDQGFYTITKFPSVWIDGAPYSSANEYPWVHQAFTTVSGPSHDNCVDKYHARSQYMSAMTLGQVAMIQRIFMMKYADTNYANKLNGLISYYYNRLYAQTATTNKNYVVLTTTDANKLYVDTRIDIGNPTSDRQYQKSMNIACNATITNKSNDIVLFKNVKTGFTISNTDYSISSSTDFDILCKKLVATGDAVDLDDNNISVQFTYTDPNTSETSDIDINLVLDITATTYTLYAYDGSSNVIGYSASGETTYSLVYIDSNVTVDTTCSAQTSIYKTGYSLGILGKDGTYEVGDFAVNSRFPSVMSGIEFLTGAYEVCGNAVFSYDSNTNAHVLIQNDLKAVTKTTATISSDYTDIGYFTHTTAGTTSKYGKDIHYDLNNGGFTIDCDGGSATTGLCDAVYYRGDQTSGLYEVLLFGALYHGGSAGPFCSLANLALSNAAWCLAARAAFVCSARAS